MYIPKPYQGKKNNEVIIAFMQRFNFGPIITTVDKVPIATHLPFVIKEIDQEIVITSHLAKANEHWKHIESNENLVIFSEPHAYISPKNYDKKENVPTWNYMAIHAYGKARIIQDPTKIIHVLETMITDFEPEYKKQWDELTDEYKSKMSKGIVAFEIRITKLESKEKLSQNKKENERKNIMNSLSNSPNENERTIAEYMKLNETHITKNNSK